MKSRVQKEFWCYLISTLITSANLDMISIIVV